MFLVAHGFFFSVVHLLKKMSLFCKMFVKWVKQSNVTPALSPWCFSSLHSFALTSVYILKRFSCSVRDQGRFLEFLSEIRLLLN